MAGIPAVMKYLPLSVNLHGQPVLLVGGGEVALRKARQLSRCKAIVTVVAPAIDPTLRKTVLEAGGFVFSRCFEDADIEAKRLVVAATDSTAVNRRISALCHNRNILVNVVDQPALCSVVFPAVVNREPLTIAISSGGSSPVLTRMLRAKIESTVSSNYGKLADFAAAFRAAVKQSIIEPGRRRHFWEDVLQGPVGEMVLSGRREEADALLVESLRQDAKPPRGEVYLVGAGPGDPDLLTFKAYRLMQKAEIVLYDRLVAPAIVDLCRADAERIYVGKARSDHALPQQEINQLLLQHARAGKRVLRLKGGDPFIFGRGGEEIEQLAEHGVPFQVVPGITAASGCASYAGIPLTHRDYAQSVRFVTGHLQDGTTDLNWNELVSPQQTLVFYMSLTGLPTICRQLMAHGRAGSTPVALIEQGTTSNQRVFCGQLDNFVAIIAAAKPRAPTLLIVGEVVKLRSRLAWFGADTPQQE